MFAQLLSKIKNKKFQVGIIGLGYVGLPLAIRFLNAKINVIGFETDSDKNNLIQNGICYIENKKFKNDKYFRAFRKNVTSDYSKLSSVDIIIVCLPTPLTKSNKPDISILKKCANKISRYLKENQMFILESTVYPGATIEIYKILNKYKKYKLGYNFFLSFSPERENPGDKLFSYKYTPKVVSGYSPICLKIAFNIYKLIARKVFLAKSINVAEMSKLLENTFRSVNIGLVNEFKIISNKLKINIWDVIEAAKTKNFGFRAFHPGPGVGGHCIPIDPLYLSWILEKKNINTNLIKTSSKLNSSMPDWVTKKLFAYLKKNKNKSNKITVFGLSYKKNTKDMRGSPAMEIIKKLIKKKYRIKFYDPLIKKVNYENKYFSKNSISLKSAYNLKKDITIIATDHSNINYKKIFKTSKIIFDTRGVYKKYVSDKLVFL